MLVPWGLMARLKHCPVGGSTHCHTPCQCSGKHTQSATHTHVPQTCAGPCTACPTPPGQAPVQGSAGARGVWCQVTQLVTPRVPAPDAKVHCKLLTGLLTHDLSPSPAVPPATSTLSPVWVLHTPPQLPTHHRRPSLGIPPQLLFCQTGPWYQKQHLRCALHAPHRQPSVCLLCAESALVQYSDPSGHAPLTRLPDARSLNSGWAVHTLAQGGPRNASTPPTGAMSCAGVRHRGCLMPAAWGHLRCAPHSCVLRPRWTRGAHLLQLGLLSHPHAATHPAQLRLYYKPHCHQRRWRGA